VTCGTGTQAVTGSAGTKLWINPVAAPTAHYVIVASQKDTTKSYCYDSGVGGAVKLNTAAAAATITVCN
jgi:hypothetical protein